MTAPDPGRDPRPDPEPETAPEPGADPGLVAGSAPGPDGGLIVGADGLTRCAWAGAAPEYPDYHDHEWGRRLTGDPDDAHFERLSLEAFQSGLSWITILRKREAFRRAFAGFRIAAVAAFTPADVDRLLQDAGIIRNRAKIDAVIGNARLAAGLSGGLAALLWSFAPATRPRPATPADVPASTPESTAMAAGLRRLGFRFVGPTTAYALMQAVGMVDDHLRGCQISVGQGD